MVGFRIILGLADALSHAGLAGLAHLWIPIFQASAELVVATFVFRIGRVVGRWEIVCQRLCEQVLVAKTLRAKQIGFSELG